MGVFFINLGMLAGLAALSVPILIHLLLKRKKQRLRFSTLRFFQQQDERSSERRKLRNLLLLAVRLLLLALLVLAFTRPYLPNQASAERNEGRRLAIIVIDRSASMQASDAEGPRWPRARESIQRILAGLSSNDRAALIGCALQAEVLHAAAPPEALGKLVKELQPGNGSANIGEGLGLAGKIASSAATDLSVTIYVISDLQSSTCKEISTQGLPAGVEVKPIQVGDLAAPNLAITQLQFDSDTGAAGKPQVTVANFSGEATKAAKLKLLIDDKEAGSRELEFGTGSIVRVEFSLPRMAPGWHSAVARIENNDGLSLDNIRYEPFHVPEPLHVLIAETRRGKRIFEKESFFIASALDPLLGTTNPAPARFAVEKVYPEELVKRLSRKREELNAELICLPGLKQIPAGLPGALAEFVLAGGGLVMFLNEDADPSRYNSEFRELLPARLGHLERSSSEAVQTRWHLQEYNLNSPMFAPFRRLGSGNLSLPEFTSRFTIFPNPASVVYASFEEDTPAILSIPFGRGHVVLANTSADTAWTDWPKHKTFVPWLHSLCFSLSRRPIADQIRSTVHLTAGNSTNILMGENAKHQTFQVRCLGEKATNVTADEEGRLPNLDFTKPGIYSIANTEGSEMQRLAVNIPIAESDLSAISPAEFQRQLRRAPDTRPLPVSASLLGANDHRKELTRLLLLITLGFLFAETLLANRTFA